MTRKVRGRIAGILVCILLGLSIISGSVTAADVTSEGLADSSAETMNAETNMTEDGMVEQNEVPVAEDSETVQEGGHDQGDFVTSVRGLINYVGVESPYLEAPAEQQLVVSYGDGSESVSDARLVCRKTDGKTVELALSEKKNELYLFKRTFEENEAGVYQMVQFVYTQDGVEYSVDFGSIGIRTMFGVNEYYPGYETTTESDAAEISEEDVEVSVVNIEADDVESAKGDIEEAIEMTSEDVAENNDASKDSANKVSRTMGNLLTSFTNAVMPAVTAKAAENVVVVLDPGHGGSDGGATGNGLVEKNLTLKIAQYCKEELEEYSGVTVYMTRESDAYVGLTERVQMAKAWGADVFVSIHINSATPSANGAEVWYPNSSYNAKIHNQGKDLSNEILEQLVALGLSDRGIKIRNSETGSTYDDGSIADYYSVIKDSKKNGFPGIIVEHAFISNASDAAKLAQDSFLKKMGIADATGIANYFGLTKGANIQVSDKNDFAGTAAMDVAGLGKNATVKIWNEETNASKEYSVASGKSTIDFNVNEYGGARGTYWIEAFSASGVSLKKLSFYVSKDTSSNVSIDSDGTEKQYEVNVKFADMPSEVQQVEVPVWTSENQSDIKWYQAKKVSDGTWKATINVSDYKVAGMYNVHVYAKLENGESVGLKSTAIEVSVPSMETSIQNYNEKQGTFDVVISNIQSPSGIDKVQVPVWCAADQSDIKWYDAEKQNDGSYKVTVTAANHNYATGTYQIHAYLTAGNGITVGKIVGEQKISFSDITITVNDITKKETTYALSVSNVEKIGTVKNVQFAVWSEDGGQDDLVWYTGKKASSGEWTTTINIKDHKTTGVYNVHAYATLANGNLKGLGTDTFEISKLGANAAIQNYDENKGTFEVVIKNISSPSGIERVQVPVWCASDQSDIKWYDAKEQKDGSYKVTVSMANHKYATGNYKVHVYLTSGNGIMSGMVAGEQRVILPYMEIGVADLNGKETEYTLTVSNVELLGVVRNVQFAVWSEEGGQDDLIWYDGIKHDDGSWTAVADITDHKTVGIYNVHIYATLANGTLRGLGTTTFEVSKPKVSEVAVEGYDETTGMFKVVISGAEAASGISEVQVPVWCTSDQSDIKWYTAEKQSDGTYTVNVDPVNHNYNSGLYKIHIYVTMKNGIRTYVTSTSQMVTAKYYTIMGETTTSVEQMIRYYESSGYEYPSIELGAGGAGTLEKFCQLYYEEANAEGVRAEVAFAQAMKETGWLQYGGIVQISQFNFAGIGALNGNLNGVCASFLDVRTGIRAQIQHLKAYASTESLVNEQVDPRFHLVKRGSAPYVEWLGQKENPAGTGWATQSNYGYAITAMIKQLKKM